jgi:heme/copper-type cytochrome/quinol oxidase subunit 2
LKIIQILLAVIGIFCLAYAYWGLETTAGQTRYEEMDGFIPFFIGIGGATLLVIAVCLVLFTRWKRRRTIDRTGTVS